MKWALPRWFLHLRAGQNGNAVRTGVRPIVVQRKRHRWMASRAAGRWVVLYGSGVSGQQNRRANVAAADTHILL
ncbi:hypothetical protein [Pantoea ananatis]|uniref:hypothetical protein n=1 Tax=Pantoea ananas TaxID=553 RepID=UPI0014037CCD|nr:hypothetical protein [Pantoea ananatis]